MEKTENMDKYICCCGYKVNESDLTDDWECLVCGNGKEVLTPYFLIEKNESLKFLLKD